MFGNHNSYCLVFLNGYNSYHLLFLLSISWSPYSKSIPYSAGFHQEQALPNPLPGPVLPESPMEAATFMRPSLASSSPQLSPRPADLGCCPLALGAALVKAEASQFPPLKVGCLVCLVGEGFLSKAQAGKSSLEVLPQSLPLLPAVPLACSFDIS